MIGTHKHSGAYNLGRSMKATKQGITKVLQICNVDQAATTLKTRSALIGTNDNLWRPKAKLGKMLSIIRESMAKVLPIASERYG